MTECRRSERKRKCPIYLEGKYNMYGLNKICKNCDINIVFVFFITFFFFSFFFFLFFFVVYVVYKFGEEVETLLKIWIIDSTQWVPKTKERELVQGLIDNNSIQINFIANKRPFGHGNTNIKHNNIHTYIWTW